MTLPGSKWSWMIRGGVSNIPNLGGGILNNEYYVYFKYMTFSRFKVADLSRDEGDTQMWPNPGDM